MKKVVAHILPVLLLSLIVIPSLVLAQGNVPQLATGKIGQTFTAIVTFMNNILVPFVFALAFLVFIWGMFKAFILGGSDEAKQSEGKALMFYAIIGFVVMVSIWGIVNLLAGGFGLTDQGIQTMPDLPTGNN